MKDYWFPGESEPKDPAWWRPIERFAEIVVGIAHVPLLLPCDFMLMGRVERRGRPGIWEYKHKDTRRYLQIDDALTVYRYIAPRDLEGNGRYVRDRGGWRSALARLELDLFEYPRDLDWYCDGCQALLAQRQTVLEGRLDV